MKNLVDSYASLVGSLLGAVRHHALTLDCKSTKSDWLRDKSKRVYQTSDLNVRLCDLSGLGFSDDVESLDLSACEPSLPLTHADVALICSSASRGSGHDGCIVHFFRSGRAHHVDVP